MKNNIKIAIVGYGFVGKAVEYGFRTNENQILIIDPAYNDKKISVLDEYQPDLTFVCVPTPMGEDGSIDSTIIEDVMSQLLSVTSGVIAIKSTITPDIVERICRTPRVLYNPEFLTERNAFAEFVNPPFHIIGGHDEMRRTLKMFYVRNSICSPAQFFYMSAKEASFVKYGINTFLASKVIWFNEFKDLVEKHGCRYNLIANVIGNDERVGSSHTKVPGPDGKRGYGGACFPKDTSALYHFSEGDLTVLGEIIRANNGYRAPYELDEREKAQGVKYEQPRIPM